MYLQQHSKRLCSIFCKVSEPGKNKKIGLLKDSARAWNELDKEIKGPKQGGYFEETPVKIDETADVPYNRYTALDQIQ